MTLAASLSNLTIDFVSVQFGGEDICFTNTSWKAPTEIKRAGETAFS